MQYLQTIETRIPESWQPGISKVRNLYNSVNRNTSCLKKGEILTAELIIENLTSKGYKKGLPLDTDFSKKFEMHFDDISTDDAVIIMIIPNYESIFFSHRTCTFYEH